MNYLRMTRNLFLTHIFVCSERMKFRGSTHLFDLVYTLSCFQITGLELTYPHMKIISHHQKKTFSSDSSGY